ncbi:hypothetical protein GCM10008967_02310 [Bacillus carboniphilus]|uniref:Glyoxalase/fosfomycin resistance/dioxygenase domain-containing protein n=1 Tax=Bacillus carboniphilus TaxID=86663 RepID=A0ABP3FDC8_9BACI
MSTSVKKDTIVQTVGGAILHVQHIKESAVWYSKLLDLPLEDLDDETPFYGVDMDEGLGLLLDDHRNLKGQRHPICMLHTNDIQKALSFINGMGCKISLELQNPHPGLAYFNFEDTEGNILMMCESNWEHPNPKSPKSESHPIKNHINTLVIPVQNLKRATEFYSRLLEKPIKPDRQDGGPIYWFDEGILLDDNRNNQDLESFPTYMLKASNIHEAYQYVKNEGIEVVRDIQFDHYFMIKDKEGNTVMVCL